MKFFPSSCLALLAALTLCACNKPADGPTDPPSAPGSGSTSANENPSTMGNPLTAPLDYVGAVGNAKNSANRRLGDASLQTAVTQFQAGEGRNPSSLQELVDKQYLKAIPVPPRGSKIVYDPKTGEVGVIREP